MICIHRSIEVYIEEYFCAKFNVLSQCSKRVYIPTLQKRQILTRSLTSFISDGLVHITSFSLFSLFSHNCIFLILPEAYLCLLHHLHTQGRLWAIQTNHDWPITNAIEWNIYWSMARSIYIVSRDENRDLVFFRFSQRWSSLEFKRRVY